MFKKLFLFLIVATLASLTLFSCNSKDKNSANDNSSSDQSGNNDQTGDNSSSVNKYVWGNGVATKILVKENSKLTGDDVYEAISWNTDTLPIFTTNDAQAMDNEFIFGEANRELYKTAERALYNYVNTDSDEHGWVAYFKDGSIAIAYTSNAGLTEAAEYIKDNWFDKSLLTFDNNGVVAQDKFVLSERAEQARREYREKEFARIKDELGAETATAFQKLFSMFDDRVYVWLANLYEPNICICTGLSESVEECQHTPYCGGAGFYFNNDGRDTVGFLPDIESTVQALHHLVSGGMFDSVGGAWQNVFSEEDKQALLKFAKSLQSSEDGYFYHPQWGTNIIAARRGRDLGWAQSLISECGGKPYWNTPGNVKGELGAPGANATLPVAKLTGKLTSSAAVAVSMIMPVSSDTYLPEYLRSLDAWKLYIDELNILNDPYTAGNTLAAMHNEIKNAGDAYINYLTSYLTNNQNKETGFWGDGVSYVTMNGFMKLSYSFSYYGRVIPNVEKAFYSTIDILLTPDTEAHDLHVCNTYNTWVNFNQIFNSLSKVEGGEEKIAELRAVLREKAPELINITYDKYLTHLQPDGTFSYFEKTYGSGSQGAPVAPGLRMLGDVNATSIVTTGTTNQMFSVLGIQNINFYNEEDMDYFIEVLDDLSPVVKNTAPKVETQTFDSYVKNDYHLGVENLPSDVITNIVLDKTEQNGVYKFFGASVVKDPQPSSVSDKAMKINSYIHDGVWSSVPHYSYSYVNIKNTVMMGNMYSFGFDVLVADAENKLIAEIAFVSEINESTTPSSAFTLELRAYTGADGKQYLKLVDKYPGTDGIKAKIVDNIPVGEWVNIKIDLYESKTTADGTTSSEWIRHGVVSINGEVKAVSEASYLTTGSTPGGKVVSKAIHGCTLAYARENNFEIYIDNVRAEEFIASYDDVKIPDYTAPDNAIEVVGKPSGTGVYYASDKRGTRLNFNGDLVYLPVVDFGMGDDYYVLNPDDKTDRYLAFYRTGATGHTYMITDVAAKTQTEIAYTSPMTVLEFDAYFDNLPANASNFMKVTMAEYHGSADFYFRTDADGKIGFNNVAEKSVFEPLEQKKWYNLRFEYYPIGKYSNKTARIKVFVDGEYAAELNGVDVKYFPGYTTSRHKCTFQLQNSAPESILVYDNLYYGYENKAYEVFKEPVPECGLPTISGTHNGGTNFNSSSSTGSKFAYDANTPKPIPGSSGTSAKTYMTEDGYVWFYRVDTAIAQEYIVYSNPSAITANNLTYIYEFDFAAGNLPSGNLYAGFLAFRGNGFTASVYYGANSAGEITFANAKGEHSSFSFKQNEWHNLRFEVHYLSKQVYAGAIFVKIYVDGQFACDVQALDIKENNKKDTLLYLQNASSNAWIAYDNVYLGYTDKLYVPDTGVTVPEEPEIIDPTVRVDSPETTGTHTGGGVYLSNANGNRFAFDNAEDLPLTSSSNSSASSYITKDKYLLFSQRTKAQSYITFAFKSMTAEEKASRKGNIVEFDAVFGGLDDKTASALIGRVLMDSQEGGNTSAYFYYNVTTKKIELFKWGSPACAVTVNPGEWNNFRFEYWNVEGNIITKLYVNGEYVGDFKGADSKAGKSENKAYFYFHDIYTSGTFVGFDNIYTGYNSTEYSEPTVTPPSGGNEGGGNTGSGGEDDDEPTVPSIDVYTDFENDSVPSGIKTTSDKYKVDFAIETLLGSKRLKVSYPEGAENGGNNEWSFYPSGYEVNANTLVFESDIVISPAESTDGTYGLTFRTGSLKLLAFTIAAKDGKVTSSEKNSGVSGMNLGNTNEVIKLKLVYRVVKSGDLFYPSADVYVGGEKIATVTSKTSAAEADILPSKIARVQMTKNPTIDGVIYFDNYKLVGLYEAPLPPVVEGDDLATFENDVTAGITSNITASDKLQIVVSDSPAARYEGDKALKVTTTGTGTTVGTTKVPLMSGSEGDCYVFETDFYYTTGSNSGNFATLYFYNEAGNQVFKYSYSVAKSSAESSVGYIRIMCNGGDNSNGNYLYIGGSNTSGKWVNIRIEMYIADGKWKAQYFLDDVFVYEDLSSSKVTTASALSYLEITHVSLAHTTYYDNVSFVRCDKEYSIAPETNTPEISGTKGTGVYYNAAEAGEYVVNFDAIIPHSGNGRANSNYDVGPAVTSNHLVTSSFNANGFAYAYKTGLKYKDDGTVDTNYHSTIKYSGFGNGNATDKTIVEFDMAVSTPDSSLPIVFSYRANGITADFYMGYSKTGDAETLKFNNVTLLDGMSATIALGSWHNVRLEIDPSTLEIPEGSTKGSVIADLYINGIMVGTIKGLDAKAYNSTAYFGIQLRAASSTTKLCYDNLYIGYKEKSTKEAAENSAAQ